MNITIRECQAHDLEDCKLLWRELTQRHRDIYLDQSIGGDPGVYFKRYLTAFVGAVVLLLGIRILRRM